MSVESAESPSADLSPERLRPVLDLIVVAQDGDSSIIGRPDLNLFIAVPLPGGAFVSTLQETGSLEEATTRASELAGETVDGVDFLEGLLGAGLFDEAVTQAVRQDGQRQATRWFEGISQPVARRFFGRVAWLVYAAAAIGSAVLIAVIPDVRPHYRNVWFLEDKALSSLVVAVLALALTAVHEAWHWLAGRAVGVPATFRISRRGVFLVIETDVSQLVTVPRRARSGVYLAGMAVDAVVLFAALVLQWVALWTQAPDPWSRFLGAVVLLNVLGIGQQWALVFLRSDVYALLANVLGCHNLYRATWLSAKARVHGLDAADRAEWEDIGAHDRHVARWFGLVYLAGCLMIGAFLVFWVLPYLAGMIRWLAPILADGDVSSMPFWTAVILLAYSGATWIAPPVLALRERGLRKRGVLL